VLSFLRHVDNETLIEPVTAYSAEIIPLIRNHTLFSEWSDFVAQLEALGVPSKINGIHWRHWRQRPRGAQPRLL
jgi:hypothetical protein